LVLRFIVLHYLYLFLSKKELTADAKEYFPYFRRAELRAGGLWLWKLPQKVDKLSLYAGLSANFDFFMTYGLTPSETSTLWFDSYEENWFISPDLQLKAEYSIKRVQFQGKFSLPIFTVGNFCNQFHSPITTKDNLFKTKILPNNFLLPNRIFYPNASLSALFPVSSKEKSKVYFQLKYVFENINIGLKYF
jgi:hypothetical protein